MSQYGRRAPFACEHCDVIFTRRLVDASRTTSFFCSKDCHAASMRTGRRKLEVVCAGCGVSFRKLPAEVARSKRHYCSPRCYLANVDRAALGRAGAAVPREVSPIARFLRAQKAGLARARNLSPARLTEIAMMGVAARLAKGATRGPYRSLQRREIQQGRSWLGPLMQRRTVEDGDG